MKSKNKSFGCLAAAICSFLVYSQTWGIVTDPGEVRRIRRPVTSMDSVPAERRPLAENAEIVLNSVISENRKRVLFANGKKILLISDENARIEFDKWYQEYANYYAKVLASPEECKLKDTFQEEGDCIIDIRKQAVGKIRALAKELGVFILIDEETLNGNNDKEICIELDRLNELYLRREQGRKWEAEAADFKAASEKARSNAERLEETEKSFYESQRRFEYELEEQRQKIEDYRRQLEDRAEFEQTRKQRQDRLYDAFYDIFEGGEVEDPEMVRFFVIASELSSEFKTLLADLKTAPAVRRSFKQKAEQLEKVFWAILSEHEEMQALIDQTSQNVIGD